MVVAVRVGVKLRVGEGENVNDGVGVELAVGVAVRVAVCEKVNVAVGVTEGVFVGVCVRVGVGVTVAVFVPVAVDVAVPVGVGVGVGVGPIWNVVPEVAQAKEPPLSRSSRHAGTLLEPQVTLANVTTAVPLATPRKTISASFVFDRGNGLGQAIAMQILPGSARFP